MIETPVMVDSHVLIHLMRHNRDPMWVLDEWKGDRGFVTRGMIRMEVERGVVGTRTQFKALSA
jgi:hypothetical protein